MNIDASVRQVLRDVLSLGARADSLTPTSPLLGAIPEMDSMAVVNVIAALEDQFDITVEDDEITGETFATFGAVTEFVRAKTEAA